MSVEIRTNVFTPELIAAFRQRKVPNTLLKIPSKGLASTILDYEKKFESDLILIMTRQEDIFYNKLGTAAREIIYQSKIPVMSIKPHDREDVPSPFTY